MTANATTIVVFEDKDREFTDAIKGAVEKAWPPNERSLPDPTFLWSKQAVLNGADGITLDSLSQASAIIVDLDIHPAHAARRCVYCAKKRAGMHMLLAAREAGAISRTFVCSANLEDLDTDPSPFSSLAGVDYVDSVEDAEGLHFREMRETLADLLAEGLAVFEKKTIRSAKSHPDPPPLAPRVVAAAYLHRERYSASPALRGQLYHIARESATGKSVLIVGNRGTGKETAARYLHVVGSAGLSSRGRLVTFNCAGLDIDTARSELFGHVRGAFTDAKTHRLGAVFDCIPVKTFSETPGGTYADLLDNSIFENDGAVKRIREHAPFGTLFLDEFAELPRRVQALLLRFLENGEVQPMGYSGTILLVDAKGRRHVRLIAATNSQKVRRAFLSKSSDDVDLPIRADLLDRVADWEVLLDDLTREEVRALVQWEVELFHEETGQRRDWSDRAIEHLQALVAGGEMPGNRRQCRKLIRKTMSLIESDRLAGNLLPVPGGEKIRLVEKKDVENARLPVTVTPRTTDITDLLKNFLPESDEEKLLTMLMAQRRMARRDLEKAVGTTSLTSLVNRINKKLRNSEAEFTIKGNRGKYILKRI